ncbi:MAG: DUF4445 domain-containing protein [Chloroflexi bacterium]|nr:DUF4445 domain-containing protein [Chloroflexota bacterium]
MAQHSITFYPSNKVALAPTGSLLTESLRDAGLDLAQPCGGQGRCGRCAVIVESGNIRRRSTIRLSASDLEAGYALACQAVIEGDAAILIPEQEAVERRLVTDKTARKVEVPFAYDPIRDQTIRAFDLALDPPTLEDSIDDLSRLERALAAQDISNLEVPLPLLRQLGSKLRAAEWNVTAIIETDHWKRNTPRLIDVNPSDLKDPKGLDVCGIAIDIGTTTVSVYLVNLMTGEAIDTAAEYNGQINRGEDVISRIIYANKNGGLSEMGDLVRKTINDLIDRLVSRNKVDRNLIYKATVSGNTTMMHLFAGLPPASIRLTPYIPTVNHPAPLLAADLDLNIHPLATVDLLPSVASYVGADITAGVLASGLSEADELTLFIDVGTNGEMALGTKDWFVTCACSAGPAFEGAGVVCGMRATRGAIEEVWINTQTFEPTYRVIGEVKPKGICGSGLISLVAELFITGVVDKGGKFKLELNTPRVREGEHGGEYVVAWANESDLGRDIVITKVDIDNLMRAKAAIYAGFTVLAQSVGVDLADVQKLLVGGSFGKYINVEKAVQIGLLPDMQWERFNFLGNTSVLGAYMALLSREARSKIKAIAEKMTYIELSADNTFYDSFTSALFLPHTDMTKFPSVEAIWDNKEKQEVW